jgi:heptosyltransferase-2
MQQPPTRLPWCPNWLFGVWINNTVLEGNPNIDTIIRFEEKHRKAKKIPESSLEIRANKYDLLIDAYSKLKLVSRIIEWSQEAYLIRKRTHFLYTDNVPFEELPKTNLGLAIERRLSLLNPFTYR